MDAVISTGLPAAIFGAAVAVLILKMLDKLK